MGWKDKVAQKVWGVIKTKKGGVEAITGVAPKVSKNGGAPKVSKNLSLKKSKSKPKDSFDFLTTGKQERRNIHQWKRNVKWPTKKDKGIK